MCLLYCNRAHVRCGEARYLQAYFSTQVRVSRIGSMHVMHCSMDKAIIFTVCIGYRVRRVGQPQTSFTAQCSERIYDQLVLISDCFLADTPYLCHRNFTDTATPRCLKIQFKPILACLRGSHAHRFFGHKLSRLPFPDSMHWHEPI